MNDWERWGKGDPANNRVGDNLPQEPNKYDTIAIVVMVIIVLAMIRLFA